MNVYLESSVAAYKQQRERGREREGERDKEIDWGKKTNVTLKTESDQHYGR